MVYCMGSHLGPHRNKAIYKGEWAICGGGWEEKFYNIYIYIYIYEWETDMERATASYRKRERETKSGDGR